MQAEESLKFDSYNPNPNFDESLREKFFRDGYVVIPNAMPEKLRNRALRLINRSLGNPTQNPQLKMIPKILSSCPELMLSDEVVDLMRKSTVLQNAHSLMGTKTYRTWAGQIALRYPGDLCIPPEHLKQYDGVIEKFFLKKGMEAIRLGGGQYVNKEADDDEFQVVPGWELAWHVGNQCIFLQTKVIFIPHRWVAESYLQK